MDSRLTILTWIILLLVPSDGYAYKRVVCPVENDRSRDVVSNLNFYKFIFTLISSSTRRRGFLSNRLYSQVLSLWWTFREWPLTINQHLTNVIGRDVDCPSNCD